MRTTNELLAFLYIARGSAGECRSMLCVLQRRRWIKELKPQIAELKATAESCSRQLCALADSLQDSDIKGPRHLNAKTRREDDGKKRAAGMRKDLLRRLPAGHPLRREAEERGEI